MTHPIQNPDEDEESPFFREDLAERRNPELLEYLRRGGSILGWQRDKAKVIDLADAALSRPRVLG